MNIQKWCSRRTTVSKIRIRDTTPVPPIYVEHIHVFHISMVFSNDDIDNLVKNGFWPYYPCWSHVPLNKMSKNFPQWFLLLWSV